MRWLAIVTVFASALSGCANQSGGPQIVRFLFTPIVIPDPNEFKLSAAVQNFGNSHWDGGTLGVYGFYNPNGDDDTGNIRRAVYFQGQTNIPPLDPGTRVEAFVRQPISSFGLQPGSIPASSCAQFACNGHLHLILQERWSMQVRPPNTNVSITWAKSGSLSDLKIVDEGP
jgi:hypothetical protein